VKFPGLREGEERTDVGSCAVEAEAAKSHVRSDQFSFLENQSESPLLIRV
jgi:hypothetical protein